MRFQLAVSLGLILQHAAHAQPHLPIGQGNRFTYNASDITGLGFGERELGPLLNVDEIQAGIEKLAKASAQVQVIEAPHKTFEGRKVYGVALGKPRVVIVGGMSGAERGGPDSILYFLSDLLRANRTGVGLVYGDRSYTKEQVVAALSAGIAVLPLSNPDGAVFDGQTGQCWQRNRNTTTLDGGDKQRGGVDLDHNFPFAWKGEDATGRHPGYEPQSEAETRNVMWFLDRFGDVSWYLNLRPAGSRSVRWGWGHAALQTTNATEHAWNSECPAAGSAREACAEFIEPDAAASQQEAAAAIAAAMGGTVEPYWSPAYPKTGASAGWASAGYYGHRCGANRVNSLTLDPMSATLLLWQPGPCLFSYPTRQSLKDGVRAAGAGLMELLLHAAGPDGEPKRWQC